MIEPDTVKLLRECDAGIKMGVSSIEEVFPHVEQEKFKKILSNSRKEHLTLQSNLQTLLNRYQDEGKEPAAIAKGMSWMKTNLMLGVNNSDQTVADLMTDGCNMGVKSLSRYLNQYTAADEQSKNIAKQLIDAESRLAVSVRDYL